MGVLLQEEREREMRLEVQAHDSKVKCSGILVLNPHQFGLLRGHCLDCWSSECREACSLCQAGRMIQGNHILCMALPHMDPLFFINQCDQLHFIATSWNIICNVNNPFTQIFHC